jgi:hypothetical protein
VITAAVVMQTDLPHTLLSLRDRVVATLAGAVAAMVLIALREQGLLTLPLFAAGLALLAVLAAAAPTLRLACTTLTVVFLIPAEGDPFLRPLLWVGEYPARGACLPCRGRADPVRHAPENRTVPIMGIPADRAAVVPP